MSTGKDTITKKDENTEKDTCGCADGGGCTNGDTLVEEEDRDVINDLRSLFDDPDCAYPINDIIDELKELGYENPGGVVTLALHDDVLYVDSVEDDGMVYLAVVEQGEEE